MTEASWLSPSARSEKCAECSTTLPPKNANAFFVIIDQRAGGVLTESARDQTHTQRVVGCTSSGSLINGARCRNAAGAICRPFASCPIESVLPAVGGSYRQRACRQGRQMRARPESRANAAMRVANVFFNCLNITSSCCFEIALFDQRREISFHARHFISVTVMSTDSLFSFLESTIKASFLHYFDTIRHHNPAVEFWGKGFMLEMLRNISPTATRRRRLAGHSGGWF